MPPGSANRAIEFQSIQNLYAFNHAMRQDMIWRVGNIMAARIVHRRCAMKTCSIDLIVVILLMAAQAFSQGSVTSANIVGYTNVTLKAGNNFVSFPFATPKDAMSGWMFTSRLPDDTRLQVYDGKDMKILAKYVAGQWVDDNLIPIGDFSISNGIAFVLSVPEESSVMFFGEVPNGTVTNQIVPGKQLIGPALPTKVGADGLAAVDGDTIWKHLNDGKGREGYDPFVYFEGQGWYDKEANLVSPMSFYGGEGFWYVSNASTNTSWEQKIH